MIKKIINFLKIEWNIIKIYLPLFLSFFIINLELDSKMGNVWYRVNSTGNKTFNFQGILLFFKAPFTNSFLWNYNLWMLNPYISSYIFLLIIKYLNKLFTK